jgi:TfoX/Sxy family transcriptional regulator of competence genes
VAREMPSFAKSPPVLVERFAAVLDRFPDVERKQMFGFPAAFVGGNMVTGLMGERWQVRLPEDAATELLTVPGAGPFEPMPGRPMRGYYVVPPSIVDDDAAIETWVGRAIDHGHSLPAKQRKAKKGR